MPTPTQHKSEDILLEARDIQVSFAGHTVLSGVSVSVRAGEIVTLIGPNGAGKTSLVKAMLGLLVPQSGTVTRKPGLSIGYMPQRLQIDASLPMTVRRFLQLGTQPGQGKTLKALKEVRADHIANSPMQSISGGEMQRVMLARALLREPDLLVLDEPVQGVDITGQSELYKLINAIRKDRNIGVLMVSHDLHVVMAQTDHVVCLNQHVCCAGHPQAVSQHPEFVALFGEDIASTLAVYAHQHDHHHDLDGHVVGDGCSDECQHDDDGDDNTKGHDHG
ncbi:MAG: zinc ABC transporter ATP-binding protein ZnuC [Rhodospirillaceae bacterium]|nr:MAG: zinc ABC transporter ATP-binding protein ZnuC [Rhodospirillaceae bacterium]